MRYTIGTLVAVGMGVALDSGPGVVVGGRVAVGAGVGIPPAHAANINPSPTRQAPIATARIICIAPSAGGDYTPWRPGLQTARAPTSITGGAPRRFIVRAGVV
ncbi:MAG: hypothetical protein KKA73_02860 [Chloroflexi bacterium]|nr:hypothetical protein [Chloroflexota bacterium]